MRPGYETFKNCLIRNWIDKLKNVMLSGLLHLLFLCTTTNFSNFFHICNVSYVNVAMFSNLIHSFCFLRKFNILF